MSAPKGLINLKLDEAKAERRVIRAAVSARRCAMEHQPPCVRCKGTGDIAAAVDRLFVVRAARRARGSK